MLHQLCTERHIKEKPIAEKEMKLLRGGSKIIPLPRQVDSRWCKIKTRCNDDNENIDFEGIQTESKVPKFIIFEADFVLETDAIKFNGIYKPGFPAGSLNLLSDWLRVNHHQIKMEQKTQISVSQDRVNLLKHIQLTESMMGEERFISSGTMQQVIGK